MPKLTFTLDVGHMPQEERSKRVAGLMRGLAIRIEQDKDGCFVKDRFGSFAVTERLTGLRPVEVGYYEYDPE